MPLIYFPCLAYPAPRSTASWMHTQQPKAALGVVLTGVVHVHGLGVNVRLQSRWMEEAADEEG